MAVSPSSTSDHDTPQSDLLNALSALHVGGKYSDLTITCNARQWCVHKAIVCSRSGFFDSACSNQFREAQSGVIDLSEDDEEAVNQMIHFLYHLDYLVDTEQEAPGAFRHTADAAARRQLPKKLDLSQIEDPLMTQAGSYALPTPPPSERAATVDLPEGKRRSPRQRSAAPPSDTESDYDLDGDVYDTDAHIILHARIYALGEKYEIASLKQLARSKFEVAMACNYDSPEFADAIEEVYRTTIDSDRGLRDVVLQAFRNHPRLATTQDVFAVIKETPSLATDLFKMERGLPV